MKTSKRFAPLWIMAFSAGTSLARLACERFLLDRDRKLSWTDVSTALVGAAAGYLLFRMRHGSDQNGLMTR